MRTSFILLVTALLVPFACVTEEPEDDDAQRQPVIDECIRDCEVYGDCVPSSDCALPCQATTILHCEGSEVCTKHGHCCLYYNNYACGYCGACT